MVNVAGNILTPALNKQLVALQSTARSISTSTSQLATGKRVSSAIDGASNFFTSLSLTSQASDLNRVLDGIANSIRTIQAADNGLKAIDSFVQTAETAAAQALGEISALREQRGTVSEAILADNPDMYLRLNEISDTQARNSGTGGNALRGIIQAGVQLDAGNLYYSNDVSETSMRFDGINDRVRLRNRPELNTSAAGYPEKTIELFFNAEDVNDGKQVLYEQGGTSEGVAIYIDDGRAYVSAHDGGAFGPFNISAEIESGETYHIAFTLDSNNSAFIGYLNGEEIGRAEITQPLSRYAAAGAIGRNQTGTVFHDGAENGNGEYFRGRISDVASYNQVLSQEKIQTRVDASLIKETKEAEDTIRALLEPINPILNDTSYRGVNLLLSDKLETTFNVERTSQLKTRGANLSIESRGLGEIDFSNPSSFRREVSNLSKFKQDVEDFAGSLSSDLNIIKTRESFIENNINTLKKGSDDLTLADQNEVGAELLASQTRQAIQFETLSFAANATNISDFLLSNPFASSSDN